MGLSIHEEDVFDLLSIGMQEMSHVLFEAQSLQQQLDSVFTDTIMPYTKFVYCYIDEILAKAIGNINHKTVKRNTINYYSQKSMAKFSETETAL